MAVFDLYGISVPDLDGARVKVERALGIRFVPHSSDYIGDYYRYDGAGKEVITLQTNYDEYERAWTEERFQDATILLYVNDTGRAQQLEESIKRLVPEAQLLRREFFD